MDHFKREGENRLALANRLSRVIISVSDIEELAAGFCKELKMFIPVDWGEIVWIEQNGLARCVPLFGKTEHAADFGETFSLEGTPIAWVKEKKTALVETDFNKTIWTWRGINPSGADGRGMKSIVVMPLFFQGEVFGGLVVGSKRANAYQEKELKLLKYAATQLAVSLKSLQLATLN